MCIKCIKQDDSIWLKINDMNNGHDLIICIVYISPANWPYARIAIFDDNQNIDFRARYVNVEFCIMGDLNARTGIADDFLVNSKYNSWQLDELMHLYLKMQLVIENGVRTESNRDKK